VKTQSDWKKWDFNRFDNEERAHDWQQMVADLGYETVLDYSEGWVVYVR